MIAQLFPGVALGHNELGTTVVLSGTPLGMTVKTSKEKAVRERFGRKKKQDPF